MEGREGVRGSLPTIILAKADSRYIANAPLALAALGALALLLCLRRRRSEATTTASLVKPGGDNLAKLEARVLMSALARTLPGAVEPAVSENGNGAGEAARLLDEEAAASSFSSRPPKFPAGAGAPLPSRESEHAINDFRADMPRGAQRWARLYFWVQLVGVLVWLGLEAARVVLDGSPLVEATWEDFRPAAFPVSLTVSYRGKANVSS